MLIYVSCIRYIQFALTSKSKPNQLTPPFYRFSETLTSKPKMASLEVSLNLINDLIKLVPCIISGKTLYWFAFLTLVNLVTEHGNVQITLSKLSNLLLKVRYGALYW